MNNEAENTDFARVSLSEKLLAFRPDQLSRHHQVKVLREDFSCPAWEMGHFALYLAAHRPETEWGQFLRQALGYYLRGNEQHFNETLDKMRDYLTSHFYER